MSKAQKTTTGWRRRYLVNVWHRQKVVEVVLARGRVRRKPDGDHHILISSKRDGKWDWYVLPDHQFLHQRNMFEASERDQMLAHVAAIRLGGYSLIGEVPSW